MHLPGPEARFYSTCLGTSLSHSHPLSRPILGDVRLTVVTAPVCPRLGKIRFILWMVEETS